MVGVTVWPQKEYAVPELTARVARRAFPKGALAMRARDAFGEVYGDEAFSGLFSERGQRAVSPARLAWVTVLQFVEGLTDRQAADAVRGRIDWKYGLGLELTDDGFDASVLCEFRQRLAGSGSAEGLLLEGLLRRLTELGLMPSTARQRSDATEVAAAIRRLNRLELVVETMRAALEALAHLAPGWLVDGAPPEWWDRYEHRADDYRLPSSEAARTQYAEVVGRDGLVLLGEVYWGQGAPRWLREVPAVQVLRRVWVQQFYRVVDQGRETVVLRGKGEGPSTRTMIESPYDTDARYGAKRGHAWRGYKDYVTETCEAGQPNLITHVATAAACEADTDMVEAIHTSLARADRLPGQHWVDSGFTSIGEVLRARDDHGIELIGPLGTDNTWQARQPGGYDQSQFTIDWDNQQVICPAGQTATGWSEGVSRNGLPIVSITFKDTACRSCPDRDHCTKGTGPRHLTLRSDGAHQALQKARAEQQSAQWRARYALRSGIESGFHQASSRCDVHRARYRGQPGTHLQNVCIATAVNLIRADDWLHGTPIRGSKHTRLSKIRPPT